MKRFLVECILLTITQSFKSGQNYILSKHIYLLHKSIFFYHSAAVVHVFVRRQLGCLDLWGAAPPLCVPILSDSLHRLPRSWGICSLSPTNRCWDKFTLLRGWSA